MTRRWDKIREAESSRPQAMSFVEGLFAAELSPQEVIRQIDANADLSDASRRASRNIALRHFCNANAYSKDEGSQ